jgi:hypothetical protein
MDQILLIWEWFVTNWYWIGWALAIWVVLSTALVTIICMNSSRCSQTDELYKE